MIDKAAYRPQQGRRCRWVSSVVVWSCWAALTACGEAEAPAPTLVSAAGGSDAVASDGAVADDGGAADGVQQAEVAIVSDAAPAADTAAQVDTAGNSTADATVTADAVAADTAAGVDAAVAADTGAAADSAAAIDSAVAADVAPPAAVCGDGICQAGTESAASCPADCGAAVPSWTGCAACAAQIDACVKGSAACAGYAKCAAACKDLTCLSGCDKVVDYATLSTYVVPLAKCLVNAGCVAPMAAGPAAGPVSCGNKACDGGETHLSCAVDCPFPVANWELCQAQKCAKSYDTCAASSACVSAATCWNQSKSQQCLQGTGGQQLVALIQCAQQACGGNPPVNASCAGKCGAKPQQGAYCQCDSECGKYGDCCPDYATLCK